jgi:hypothetical protein
MASMRIQQVVFWSAAVASTVQAVRQLAQQRVQPTPPLRHFGLEKALVVQLVLPRRLVVCGGAADPNVGRLVTRHCHPFVYDQRQESEVCLSQTINP